MINEVESHRFLVEADEEMNRMVGISMFNKYEDDNCFEICRQLVDLIKRHMKEECDAYIIGQRTMCLDEGKGDLAIFLDIGQHRFFSDRNYKENIRVMKRLENILSRDPNWRFLRLNRALPSINVIFKRTNQRCDLSITNGFSVQISAMIGHFFEIQPEAIKLYHFVRIWLKINGITFKAFTLTLLVMNYLQDNNLMPSAFRAQKNIPQNFIEGIPVSFDPNRDISSYGVKKMTYYYSHVRGFLRYYADFNFIDNVVSTYYGYPIQKDEYKPKLDYDSPMCVAAFLNQKCNTSRNISDAQMQNFMMVCNASYNYLVKNNY